MPTWLTVLLIYATAAGIAAITHQAIQFQNRRRPPRAVFLRWNRDQQYTHLRNPRTRPRCACRLYSTHYGTVIGRDNVQHTPSRCSPLREVIR